jgi:hypothetical protein
MWARNRGIFPWAHTSSVFAPVDFVGDIQFPITIKFVHSNTPSGFARALRETGS